MQSYLKIGMVLITGIFITACGHKNPIPNIDPNIFAAAVDNYRYQTGDGMIEICGSYYADPEKARAAAAKFPVQIVNMTTIESDCNKAFGRLAESLVKSSQFENIKIQDLARQDTWQRYFSAKHQMSNFFNPKEDQDKFLTWKKQY
jgi:hypothetical protein